MPDPIVPTEPVITPTATPPVEPAVAPVEAPLGAPGLSALQAERDARTLAENELKALKDRDKTDAQRQADRTAELEAENALLKSGALRSTVAAAKGVPVALLSGSTQAELEASADALIAFRGAQPSTPLVVPNEGNNPRPQPSKDAEFVSALFAPGD